MKKITNAIKKMFNNSVITLNSNKSVIVECGGNYCQDCC